ncbi:hypothetical protein GCM10009850_111470 [Nonomuraea monospora]|uniref:Transposase n=1 Tax=Nonomuraea monospora TaxID=568818 RepID=A0ABN3D1K4_9ACTN
MGEGHLAARGTTARDQDAWICFADEAGQSLRPPKARTWSRRGCTPIVTVSGKGSGRVNLAGLLCCKPGRRTRLIYRMLVYRRRKNERKGFTQPDYARLLDAAHQQLGGPIVLVWDKCAVRRLVVSPTHSGGIWRNIPGSPDSPGGESRRGQQHVRKAVTARRRPGRGAARPAR